jgi:hypothetical protein
MGRFADGSLLRRARTWRQLTQRHRAKHELDGPAGPCHDPSWMPCHERGATAIARQGRE